MKNSVLLALVALLNPSLAVPTSAEQDILYLKVDSLPLLGQLVNLLIDI